MTDDNLINTVQNDNNGGTDLQQPESQSTQTKHTTMPVVQNTRTLSPPRLRKHNTNNDSSILNNTHIVPISEDTEWNDYTEQQANIQQLQSITDAVRALYVDEQSISKHLKCIICTLPYVKPITHSSCGNVFCANCVASFQSELCPCCRLPLKNKALLSANVPLRALLDELRIKCPSCMAEMRRDQLPAHTAHGCSKSALCTQSCGKLILHNYQAEHTELHCTNATVSCPAEDIGCTVVCSRKQMDAHKQECKLLVTKYALTALRDRIDALESTLKEKNTEIKVLQSQISTNTSTSISSPPTDSRALTLTISRSMSEHRSTSTNSARSRDTPATLIDLRRSQSHSPPTSNNQRRLRGSRLPGGQQREEVCSIM